jgi:hypothetical protein
MSEEEEFNAASVTHHARGGGVQRGLSDMSAEEEFDAASAEEEFRRGLGDMVATLTLRLTLTLLQQHERGGGVRCGLSDMREEEEFDAASAT